MAEHLHLVNRTPFGVISLLSDAILLELEEKSKQKVWKNIILFLFE